MRFLLPLFALGLTTLSAFAQDKREYVRPRHSIVVRHEDGRESRLHLAQLTDNGAERPGIFFLTDHNGAISSRLDYPLEMKWKVPPKTELGKTAFAAELRSLNSDHPHHVTMGMLQGTEAAYELIAFLESSEDAYDLIYPDKKEHKKVRRRVHRKKMPTGETAVGEFNHVEREIPSDHVIIRNRRTGEERKLTEFAEVLVAKKKGDDEFLKARIGAFVAWMSGKEIAKTVERPKVESAFIQRAFVPVKRNSFYVDHQEFEDDWRNSVHVRQPASDDAR